MYIVLYFLRFLSFLRKELSLSSILIDFGTEIDTITSEVNSGKIPAISNHPDSASVYLSLRSSDASDLIQHFLRQAVRDGFFHADMHQGNIFINSSGQIVPIDFGIMGRIDKLNRRYLAEILFGFVSRDYKNVAQVHLVAGLVPKNVSVDELAQALRSIGEPIFGQSVKDISGG